MRNLSPAALSLLASLVLLAATSSTASGAVVGLQSTGVVSSTDSVRDKSLTATCPDGLKLVGGGVQVVGAEADVVVSQVAYDKSLTKLTVSAREDEDGTTANWGLTGFLQCALPLPGLQFTSAVSATDSAASKTVTVNCPTGKQLLGVGGTIKNGGGQVLMDDLHPGSVQALFRAHEDETGYAGNWSLSVYGICANPLASLQRVVTTSAGRSSPSHTVDALCPNGKAPLSAGADINSTNGQVLLTSAFPTSDNAIRVAGHEDDTGNPDSWTVTAYAVCSNVAFRAQFPGPPGQTEGPVLCPVGLGLTGVGAELDGGIGEVKLAEIGGRATVGNAFNTAEADPPGASRAFSLTGYSICGSPYANATVVQSSSGPAQGGKVTSASCPTGTRVLGGGVRVSGGGGQVVPSFIPSANLTNVRAIANEDEVGTPGDWTLTALAYCATAPPGLQLVSASSQPASSDIAAATATCPPNKHVVGTGADVSSGFGHVVIDDVVPDARLGGVTAVGIEDRNGFPGQWQVTAYAICVTR